MKVSKFIKNKTIYIVSVLDSGKDKHYMSYLLYSQLTCTVFSS